MQPARKISIGSLGGKSRHQIENLLKRQYGDEARQESVFREEKPKMKAKDRRALQRGRAGMKLKEAQEEFNKSKRINREIVRKRRSKKAASRHGYARRHGFMQKEGKL